MDKNAIKKYAIWARNDLIERVSKRAQVYGISETDFGNPYAESVNGHLLSQAEKRQRQALISKIKEKSYGQVMEEVAYTWFNRFAALRYMEVNGYLPSRVRVFTNEAGEFKPQILAEAIHLDLDGLDMEKVYELEDANKTEELYKYLLIVQCNALNRILPKMFQRIEDYTELLLPDNLLREGSVIEQMVTTIPEADWTDQVQIIGWLYQYYNTEPKDKVFANLKKNIKITKENIPAATQLFTPDWIVHYMVENSLGRLWLEGHPNNELKAGWKYYLDEAEQEPEVQAQLAEIRKEYAALTPEEIRVIDPCMGSGHILCVLFDVLVQIYEDYGYTPREAVVIIIENNLWGLDIDQRATQLAYFAVMMKATQYDHRFLRRSEIPQPHVYWPEDYPEGQEFGSLIQVDELEPEPDTQTDLYGENSIGRWQFRQALAQKYHVVVTNPPYMGGSGMGNELSKYVKQHFPDSKSDLFAVFIERCRMLTRKNGYQAMITQHAWMFLSSYEKLRQKLLTIETVNMAHLGARAFEEIGGEVVQTTSFVIRNNHISGYAGTYCRLIEPTTQQEKEDMFHSGENRYITNQDNFFKIPGTPVAYWISEALLSDFSKGKPIGELFKTITGSSTSDNGRFLRLWFEVGTSNVAFSIDSSYMGRGYKWIFCNKGGSFRRWYGNNEYLINWENDGEELKKFCTFKNGGKHWSRFLKSLDMFYKQGITWSKISTGVFSARYMPEGFIMESAACAIMPKKSDINTLLGLMNTKITNVVLNVKNPTINIQAGDIIAIPVLDVNEQRDYISQIVRNCIAISHVDWDSFETSWDFQRHPLVIPAVESGYMRLSDCYKEWVRECDERFGQLKANEEELNRIFIDIYGLADELTPEVQDKDVTVRRADLGRDIRSLISYAVGCMFGRYSIYKDGLIYAGGNWDYNKYEDLAWIAEGKPETMEFYKRIHFMPVQDDIIPISDDDYFANDIVDRFIKFVSAVYGSATLEENLRFIANALGGKGSSREVIRNYFLNDFYRDHCKIYQKRPIYWLFDSGKKNGFKCLIYMHRYQPDTIARIRTDYVHEQQSRYRTAIADVEQRINGASTSERVKLSKQLAKLSAQAEELRVYEEKIHHLADQMIQIDLDDGVKHNYEIFKDVLAKIK